MKDIEITLNAIVNFIVEHTKKSDESWNYKGLDGDRFNVKDLLELIYYVNPDLFERIKSDVLLKEEE